MFILNTITPIIQQLTWGDVKRFILANKPKEDGMAAKVGEGYVTVSGEGIAHYEILVGNSPDVSSLIYGPLVQTNLNSGPQSSKLILSDASSDEEGFMTFSFYDSAQTTCERLVRRSVIGDSQVASLKVDDLVFNEACWYSEAIRQCKVSVDEYYRASVRALGNTMFEAQRKLESEVVKAH